MRTRYFTKWLHWESVDIYIFALTSSIFFIRGKGIKRKREKKSPIFFVWITKRFLRSPLGVFLHKKIRKKMFERSIQLFIATPWSPRHHNPLDTKLCSCGEKHHKRWLLPNEKSSSSDDDEGFSSWKAASTVVGQWLLSGFQLSFRAWLHHKTSQPNSIDWC